jgi:hypothetical protein
MKLHTGLVLSSLLSLGLLTYACANGDTVNGTTGNSTGSSNTGGSSSGNTGGSSANTGGSTGNTGGSTGAGGVRATGGSNGNTGGNTGVGNTSGSTGGSTGSGNTTGSTGGTTGAGGSMATTCGSSFAVASNGFVTMPNAAGGCWSGYAYAGGDAGSTIMPDMTKQFSMCGTPCMLTMTGTVGPAVAPSYLGTAWIGFNIGQPAGTTTTPAVTPTGTGLTVEFMNSSSTMLMFRVQITDGTTRWCYQVTGASPVTIPYGMFNTACWDGTGTNYAKQPITAIQLTLAGAATAQMANLTLVSVKEN